MSDPKLDRLKAAEVVCAKIDNLISCVPPNCNFQIDWDFIEHLEALLEIWRDAKKKAP